MLAGLPRLASDGVRWTTPEQWHVTLRFLGEVADGTGVQAALARMELASMGGTVATLGPVTACFGRHVLAVPVGGLDGLADAVVSATAGLEGRSAAPPGQELRGHLTLARARGGRRGPDLRPMAGVPVSARWPVTEIALVSSILGGTGSRYQVLETWPVPADD